jgi:flagellar basal body-associated protein FliL
VKKVSALTIILVLIVSIILMFSLMYASLNYFTGFSFVKTGGLGLSIQCDKITANISDTNKKGAYVTAQFVLEVKSKRDLKFVDRNKPVINTIALKTFFSYRTPYKLTKIKDKV